MRDITIIIIIYELCVVCIARAKCECVVIIIIVMAVGRVCRRPRAAVRRDERLYKLFLSESQCPAANDRPYA